MLCINDWVIPQVNVYFIIEKEKILFSSEKNRILSINENI